MLGTASYQIEGAYKADGRGASIWDTFSGANTVGMPGSICEMAPCAVNSIMGIKGSTGNVANDHYHHYARDVEMMASFGVTAYRFSIAWPRIFPTGKAEAGPNKAGVAFYHRLIDMLVAKGIEPIVTMYHWDLPQGLLDAGPNRTHVRPCDASFAQGWFECEYDENHHVVPTAAKAHTVRQFVKYAEFLLREYGSKVKMWATFNEAWTFTYLGSGGGKAPSVFPYMDRDIWPYVAGHNVIFAHLGAVQAFRALQAQGVLTPQHQVGITNNQDWREPLDPTSAQDHAAAQAQLEGQLGWFADPIYGVRGVHDYPDSMKRLLPYLPSFSPSERAALQANAPDFFGLNHYGTGFTSLDTASGATRISEDGVVQAQSVWLYGAGWGFRQLLNWCARRYSGVPLYVTEGGWSVGAGNALEAKYDPGRLMYYFSYLSEAWKAIHLDGVDLRGYAAWSLMDNFEWERGYSERFGAGFADFQFGIDPDAPGPDAPVYDPHTAALGAPCGLECALPDRKPSPALASKQTRHAKNSLLWLEWLWRSNELPDPTRFLASSLGGDVCYGVGNYTASGRVSVCHNTSTIPGPPPASASAAVDESIDEDAAALNKLRAVLSRRGLPTDGTLAQCATRLAQALLASDESP